MECLKQKFSRVPCFTPFSCLCGFEMHSPCLWTWIGSLRLNIDALATPVASHSQVTEGLVGCIALFRGLMGETAGLHRSGGRVG